MSAGYPQAALLEMSEVGETATPQDVTDYGLVTADPKIGVPSGENKTALLKKTTSSDTFASTRVSVHTSVTTVAAALLERATSSDTFASTR
ncbi:hypothetical protein V5799_025840, partial [Amblyomma americanum]